MSSHNAVLGRRPSYVLALLLALGLVWSTAVPAAANHSSGVGAGIGTENLQHVTPTPEPPCLRVTASKYEIDVTPVGSFTAHDGGGTSQSTMVPAHITVTTKAPYYINPVGTYTNSSCAGAPQAVNVTVKVTSSAAGIACGEQNGQYTRTNTLFEVYWTGSCMIGIASTSSATSHSFVGDLLPCDPFVCAAGPAQLQGIWRYAE